MGTKTSKSSGYPAYQRVSIQLMSPASGDQLSTGLLLQCYSKVSIQLMSPASGDYEFMANSLNINKVSIQLMSPASGDEVTINNQQVYLAFPFN